LAEACVGTNITTTAPNTATTATRRRTTDTADIGQSDDGDITNDSVYCTDGYRGPCKCACASCYSSLLCSVYSYCTTKYTLDSYIVS
jgi:hypothetical protein